MSLKERQTTSRDNSTSAADKTVGLGNNNLPSRGHELIWFTRDQNLAKLRTYIYVIWFGISERFVLYFKTVPRKHF